MTQSAAVSSPQTGSPAQRVAALRAWLAAHGFDGLLVPHSDEYQSEFLPPSAERLAWISGFTGSAGTAIVLAERAALFVDGRYTLQASMQVDQGLFEICRLADWEPEAWLAAACGAGQRIAYDPRLFTKAQIGRYRTAARRGGIDLAALDANPIDALWRDRPAPPASPIVAHPLAFAGVSSRDKRATIAATLAEAGDDALILTTGDSIAWLFNIRGRDVAFTPLALCFAVLHADASARIFAAASRVAPEVSAQLGGDVDIADPQTLPEYLDALGARGARVRLSPTTAAIWFFDRLAAAGADIAEAADPCMLAKAVKNDVELAGARAAHVRDGVALSRFLAWLDRQPVGSVDELGAAARLEALRRTGEHFQDLSFATIAGAGPNGAIVHYRAGAETNRPLGQGLFLVDSGAQYLDGTTDVTRTVAIGTPSAEMRRHYTLVLKDHIAIACARFPAGTRGSQLDALARRALWQAGLDYDHGTGHGVGSYLGVHEGPQRISKLAGDEPLRPGMIVSNEPGYYRQGAYGIRIENLVEVVALDRATDRSDYADNEDGADSADSAESERAFLGFADLTRAPIDRRLIDMSLLTTDEIAWVDAYHARVMTDVGPSLEATDRDWLAAATAPL